MIIIENISTYLSNKTEAATSVYAARVPIDIKSTSSFKSKNTAMIPDVK